MVALCCMLAGCAVSKANRTTQSDDAKAVALENQAEHPSNPAAPDDVAVDDEPFWGDSIKTTSHGKSLPPVFQSPHTFGYESGGPRSLPEIAVDLSTKYSIPIRLIDGADPTAPLMNRADVQKLSAVPNTGINAQQAALLDSVNRPPSQESANPAPIATLAPQIQTKTVSYKTGSFEGLLNMVASVYGVQWENRDSIHGEIVFSRYQTRRWMLVQMPDTATINASIGSSGQGGVTGSSGTSGASAGQSTGSGTGSSAGTASATASTGTGTSSGAGSGQGASTGATIDLWSDIGNQVALLVPKDGASGFAISRSTAQVSATSTPEVLERLDSYIKDLNVKFRRKVSIELKVVAVTANDQDNYGFDLNAVLANASTGLNLNVSGPPTGLSNVGSAGVSVISPPANSALKAWSGSQAAIQALSTVGKTTTVTTQVFQTQNYKALPLQVNTSQAYVANITTNAVAQVGTFTGVQQNTVNYGTILQFYPNIISNNEVLLSFALNKSNLLSLLPDGPTGQQVKDPITQQQLINQTLDLESGSTIVVASFGEIASSLDKAGVGDPDNLVLGGHLTGGTQKTRLILLITVTTLDRHNRPTTAQDTL